MPTSEEIGRVETAKAEAALPGCHPRERCTRPEGRVVLTFSDRQRTGENGDSQRGATKSGVHGLMMKHEVA